MVAKWDGKLGDLLLVFHFSRPPLWECGNLAGFWRDFQGGSWKEWEAYLRLSTLSTAPAFPQPPVPVFFASPGRLHSLSVCPLACCFFVSTAQAPRLRVLLADGTFVATPEVPAADLIPLD